MGSCFGSTALRRGFFCFICVLMDPVELIFSSLFVLAVQIVHRNAIVYCNFTLITVIFSLALSKQPSKKCSSTGMQRWILNCLQITQAAHKNIIKRQMPFVLLNYAHWGALMHLTHCNVLRRALLESASLLSSWPLISTCQSQLDLILTAVHSQMSEHGLLGTLVLGRWHTESHPTAGHISFISGCVEEPFSHLPRLVCSAVSTNTVFKPCVSLILYLKYWE